MSLPIALIRAHLNLDDERDGDLLEHYSNVACMWVSAYCGREFDAGNPLMMQAALLLVAHQYEAREGVAWSSPYQLPFGVHDLLSPLKVRVTGHVPEPEPAP